MTSLFTKSTWVNAIRFSTLVIAMVCVSSAFADQKIKTKSNIKNDRVQQSSSTGATGGDTEASSACAGQGCESEGSATTGPAPHPNTATESADKTSGSTAK